MTSSQLARFETAFHSVLGTINPRYARRPKSIYYEEEGEFDEEASGALGHGLTEAMIALAVYPDRAELITNAAGHVTRAIRKLLDKASPALWWSLLRDLHNIAEAAPGEFLEALQTGLEGDNRPIMSLFRSDEGAMHSTEYLSNLLWSLEMLARSPDFLISSALLLAHLDEVDPGGNWGNRPFASLRRIFVSWSPQTYATPTERLKVIDQIVRHHPEVGWKLLLAVAPHFHDTSEPSSMPNWRDFTPDKSEVITWPSLAAAGSAIGGRLLQQAGHSCERWCTLLDLWKNFDGKWRAAAVRQLEAFARNLNDATEIETMRDKLRGLLRNHRGFKDAQWALAEKDLKPLDKVFELLQPQGVEDRVRWLFRPGANQIGVSVDWHTKQAELENHQMEAAENLLSELSSDQLFDFASTITMHHAFGAAIARASASEKIKQELMKQGLLGDDGARADVAIGILYGLKQRVGDNGDAWVRIYGVRPSRRPGVTALKCASSTACRRRHRHGLTLRQDQRVRQTWTGEPFLLLVSLLAPIRLTLSITSWQPVEVETQSGGSAIISRSNPAARLSSAPCKPLRNPTSKPVAMTPLCLATGWVSSSTISKPPLRSAIKISSA